MQTQTLWCVRRNAWRENAKTHATVPEDASACKNNSFERKCEKIPIIGPNYYSQYSLKIQIIPLNDIENGITRLQSCSAPVFEKSYWCCYKIWWQHPCSQKETMCAKCSDTKLHEGKLRSQPWLVSWDHTVSLCYYTIVSAVSYRFTSLYSVSISYLY